MDYGNTKTTFQIDDSGSSVARIDTYWRSKKCKAMKQYKIRVKVCGPKEEMTEYLKFTDEVMRHRSDGTLTTDNADLSTLPSFIIDYPAVDVDGCYFIIKSYTVQSN